MYLNTCRNDVYKGKKFKLTQNSGSVVYGEAEE
jgi:hypothetical protein